MISPSAVVTKDIPPYAIVVGNPARITGYVQAERDHSTSTLPLGTEQRIDNDLGIIGVHLCEMPVIVDLRGSLTFA